MVDRHIGRGSFLIARQEAHIGQLRSNGHDTGEAEHILNNMLGIQDLLICIRESWHSLRNQLDS
jgi:hypothetical protein